MGQYSLSNILKNKYFQMVLLGTLAASLVFSPAIALFKLLSYAFITLAASYSIAKLTAKAFTSSQNSVSGGSVGYQEEKGKSENLDQAIATMGNGKDVDNPGVKALIDKLRDNGLTVTTNWAVAKQIMDSLPEKYSHLRDSSGSVRGFVYKGNIYINPENVDLSVPIHEYTHIWAEALRQNNEREWKNVVSLLKKETVLWDHVKKNYPYLENDDEIADEVLAHFSGQRGQERLNDFLSVDGVKPKTAFSALRKALDVFWKNVAKLFDCHFNKVEDIADRLMYDLLKGVNPEKHINKNILTMSDNKPLSNIAKEPPVSVSADISTGSSDKKERYADVIETFSDGQAAVTLYGNSSTSKFGYENVAMPIGYDVMAMIARHISPSVRIDRFEGFENIPVVLSFSDRAHAVEFLDAYKQRHIRAYDAIIERTNSAQHTFSDDQKIFVCSQLLEHGGHSSVKRMEVADSLLNEAEEHHGKSFLPEWKEQTRQEMMALANHLSYSTSKGLKL